MGGGDSLTAALAALVALVLVVFVLVPLLLLGIELIAVGVAIAVGIIGRLVLGRPWIVVAESVDAPGVGFGWRISGWRPSARVIAELAEALQAGVEPSPQGAERVTLPRGGPAS